MSRNAVLSPGILPEQLKCRLRTREVDGESSQEGDPSGDGALFLTDFLRVETTFSDSISVHVANSSSLAATPHFVCRKKAKPNGGRVPGKRV